MNCHKVPFVSPKIDANKKLFVWQILFIEKFKQSLDNSVNYDGYKIQLIDNLCLHFFPY